MQHLVSAQENLEVIEGAVVALVLDKAGAVAGATLSDGRVVRAGAVVLASGTFLGARIYCGDQEQRAGRLEELEAPKTNTTIRRNPADSIQANDSLRNWFADQEGIKLIRLKTGTPPRLAAESLSYADLTAQPGDATPCFLSFLTHCLNAPQSPCYLTRTNPETHALVRTHLEESAVGLQSDLGLGPRYCPSLEDKVVRFADRDSHNIFLEPETPTGFYSPAGAGGGDAGVENKFVEGRSPPAGAAPKGLYNSARAGGEGIKVENKFEKGRSPPAGAAPKGLYNSARAGGASAKGATVYPNGISNALPRPVQDALIATIAGLENAKIVRYGYAVSYNAFDPRGLRHTLESLALPRLFLAGQINGTTGYEEAAAQGVLAGLNAARRASGTDGIEFTRQDSYIGVLVDDLVTRGVTEPYRMLTARAEFRLSLRADNADLRLTPRGESWGLIGKQRRQAFAVRQQQLEEAKASLSTSGQEQNLSSTNLSWQELLAQNPQLAQVSAQTAQTLEADLRYAPYLERQDRERARLDKHASLRLPRDLAYGEISGLSHEARASLSKHRPTTLADALVLEGVTPTAVSLLASHLRRKARPAPLNRAK